MDYVLKNISGVTLKSLLENPSLFQPSSPRRDMDLEDHELPQNPKDISTAGADNNQQETDFEKKLKDVEGDFFAPADFGAAFLGPNLWEKTYGEDDFKLEYMELDEFLSENGLPLNTAEHLMTKEQGNTAESTNQPEEVSANTMSIQENPTVSAPSPTPEKPHTSDVKVDVAFDLNPTDVALATIPGQDVYDPRTRTFTEEELKPQPMIKKSRKIYVCPDAKDDKYWDRRRKNNIAAKRSRDARRIKENQISMRAAFLEKENNALKKELLALKNENGSLKSIVKRYEQKM